MFIGCHRWAGDFSLTPVNPYTALHTAQHTEQSK
jgi:hypothetical protein